MRLSASGIETETDRSETESSNFLLYSGRVSPQARSIELAIRTRWKTLAVLLAAEERGGEEEEGE